VQPDELLQSVVLVHPPRDTLHDGGQQHTPTAPNSEKGISEAPCVSVIEGCERQAPLKVPHRVGHEAAPIPDDLGSQPFRGEESSKAGHSCPQIELEYVSESRPLWRDGLQKKRSKKPSCTYFGVFARGEHDHDEAFTRQKIAAKIG
jgi:hypothetical protein